MIGLTSMHAVCRITFMLYPIFFISKNDFTKLKKYIILDNVRYSISNVDEDPVVRLYVPTHLTEKVMAKIHNVIHLGFDKTFNAITSKYCWPNLYKQVYEYFPKCVDCQTRNMQKIKSPLKEFDTPPFRFAEMAIDVVGPLPKAFSGNQYIVTTIDWLSGGLAITWKEGWWHRSSHIRYFHVMAVPLVTMVR